MSAMMLFKFGSTGIEEISVFQALSVGNGDEPIQVRARTRIHACACAALRKTLAREREKCETEAGGQASLTTFRESPITAGEPLCYTAGVTTQKPAGNTQ